MSTAASSRAALGVAKAVHTTYCSATCKVEHHPLLIALVRCIDTFNKELMHELLVELSTKISKFEEDGLWKRHEPIPDPNEDFRFPIVHWACALGRVTALIWLVEDGFDATCQTKDGDTGLHRALVCLPKTCGQNEPHALAVEKFTQLVKVMDTVMLVRNQMGFTPLHLCAQFLVDLDKKGKTYHEDCFIAMLDQATQKGYVKQLVNSCNHNGDTVLHMLAQLDRLIVLTKNVCQDFGADINKTNKKGDTPFSMAVHLGQIKQANFLISMAKKGTEARAKKIPHAAVEPEKADASALTSYRTEENAAAVQSDISHTSYVKSSETTLTCGHSSMPFGSVAKQEEPVNKKTSVQQDMSEPSKDPVSDTGARRQTFFDNLETSPRTRKQVTTRISPPPNKGREHETDPPSAVNMLAPEVKSVEMPSNSAGDVEPPKKKPRRKHSLASTSLQPDTSVGAEGREHIAVRHLKKSPKIIKPMPVEDEGSSTSKTAALLNYFSMCGPSAKKKMKQMMSNDMHNLNKKISQNYVQKTGLEKRIAATYLESKRLNTLIAECLKEVNEMQTKELLLKTEAEILTTRRQKVHDKISHNTIKAQTISDALDVMDSLSSSSKSQTSSARSRNSTHDSPLDLDNSPDKKSPFGTLGKTAQTSSTETDCSDAVDEFALSETQSVSNSEILNGD